MPETPRSPRRRKDVKLTLLGRVQDKSRTVLLGENESERAIRKGVDDAIERTLPRVLDRMTKQATPILTLARLAEMLGVKPRTVTEGYVKAGMPCCRPGGKRQPPVFVLEDVIAWLREQTG